MKFWFLIVMLLCSPALFAQSAKVIQLKPEDAEKAAKLYKQKQEAEKAWEDFQDEVKTGYTEEKHNRTTKAKEGWESGFEFSTDFKAIVPKSISGAMLYYGGNTWSSCCTTTAVTMPYATICSGTGCACTTSCCQINCSIAK